MSKKNKHQKHQQNPAPKPDPAGFRRPEPQMVSRDEENEPSVTRVTVPVMLIALIAAMVYLGDMYFISSGEISAKVYYPHRTVPLSSTDITGLGEMVYTKNCAVCHQGTGAGMAGQFPPLAGSDWVLTEGPNRLIRIVLHGLTGPVVVSGQNFNNSMPPFGDLLKDEEVAAVLTFIRGNKAWGNNAGPVAPEKVKPIREATAGRSSAWTANELTAVAEKD